MTNLVLPGLGTIASGRRVAGVIQLVLSQLAFLVAAIWGVRYALTALRSGELPAELDRDLWIAFGGAVVFFFAWVWAMASSFAIVRHRDDNPAARPTLRT